MQVTRARTYVLVWLALLALTGLSWATSYLALGAAELPVTLGIALVKAALVAAFFMHLVEQRLENRLVPIVALLFAVLLVTLTALDVASR